MFFFLLFVLHLILHVNMRNTNIIINHHYKITLSIHYENMSMQYTAIFHGIKNEKKKIDKKIDNFLIFAQNIDCGYTLEPSQ